MSTSKQFHIGDLLSITDGHLVSPRLIEGVYDIMNWLTGESLFTHQLVLARDECRAELLRQHPWLAEIVAPELTRETWRAWLDEQVAKYGEMHDVAPLAKRELKYDSPLGDLVEMLDGNTDKIIVVDP